MAILKTLREPDEDMERAGDIAVWQRMIGAALGDTDGDSITAPDEARAKTDPLHQGP